MIIDLSTVKPEPKGIRHVFDIADIHLDGEEVTLTAPAVLSGCLSKQADKATFSGSISTSISRDCTRCLEPIVGPLMVEFDTAFLGSDDEEVRADAEVSADELDIAVVPEGMIDLAEVVREQILLALPIQSFCRPDCKGLCQQCGANLNLKDCECSGEDLDPRWAALKNLK